MANLRIRRKLYRQNTISKRCVRLHSDYGERRREEKEMTRMIDAIIQQLSLREGKYTPFPRLLLLWSSFRIKTQLYIL